jgi:phosphoribosyl-AMP cyclohydrolase/phosphoribosyl-ATP pyrophosphohydrolase/phosphoribosyl-AMP cyclohydrolase
MPGLVPLAGGTQINGLGIKAAEYAQFAMDPATETIGMPAHTIEATPISATEAELAAVRYNADGLVPAIVQEEGTGDVLMFAWMTADALCRSLETGRMWYWSRSRQEYWCKGETSGDRQWLREARYDCDVDVLLFVVEQEGRGACHTGAHTCFFRAFGSGATPGPV